MKILEHFYSENFSAFVKNIPCLNHLEEKVAAITSAAFALYCSFQLSPSLVTATTLTGSASLLGATLLATVGFCLAYRIFSLITKQQRKEALQQKVIEQVEKLHTLLFSSQEDLKSALALIEAQKLELAKVAEEAAAQSLNIEEVEEKIALLEALLDSHERGIFRLSKEKQLLEEELISREKEFQRYLLTQEHERILFEEEKGSIKKKVQELETVALERIQKLRKMLDERNQRVLRLKNELREQKVKFSDLVGILENISS